jgi:excisionase family DNA binding protein
MPQSINPTHPPVEDLLDIEAAAALVKLKPSTIYSLTSKRQIPHIKRGNRLYFLRDELVDWLLQGRRPVINGHSATEHLDKVRGGGR